MQLRQLGWHLTHSPDAVSEEFESHAVQAVAFILVQSWQDE